jgi:hypothetical protein
MISKEELLQRVGDLLRQLGVSLVGLATDPKRLDQATDKAWKIAPFWLKPLGKERLRAVIYQLSERIPHNLQQEPLGPASPENRLQAIEEAVRQEFGDDFATKKNLRGFDAQRDLTCGRLQKECEELEPLLSEHSALIRLLLVKAQLLGMWQKLQGSKGNQFAAIHCYERAAVLADGLPEVKAATLLRFSRFCDGADEDVAGGKARAQELAASALATSPTGTAIHAECYEQLQQLSKKRWLF